MAALGALQQLFGLRQRLRQRRATAAADAAQAHTARRTGAPGWQQQLHAVATELQQRHVIALLRRLGDELRGVAFGQRQPALRAHRAGGVEHDAVQPRMARRQWQAAQVFGQQGLRAFGPQCRQPRDSADFCRARLPHRRRGKAVCQEARPPPPTQPAARAAGGVA